VDLDARSDDDDDFPSVNEDNFEGEIPPNPHWDAMEDFEYDLEMLKAQDAMLKELEEQESADAEAAAEAPMDESAINPEDVDEKINWDVDEEPDEKRRHRYCVTVWNMVKFPNMQALLEHLQNHGGQDCLRFLVGQEEVAPKTGNHHLQVYVEWKNPKGFGGMRRLFPKCWIGVPRGTADHNIAYCTHPDTAVFGTSLVWGTPGQESQGKRTDLHILCEKVMKAPNKGALRDIILEQPVAFVRNHNGILKLAGFNDDMHDFRDRVRHGQHGAGERNRRYRQYRAIRNYLPGFRLIRRNFFSGYFRKLRQRGIDASATNERRRPE